MGKPILCLDFDGVIHSYKSGWKGARNIPDEPVAGALEFIVGALEQFDVAILSSRSHQFLGRYAMKKWLKAAYVALAIKNFDSTPQWLQEYIGRTQSMDPWEDEVEWAARLIVKAIKWPLFKPAAMVTIDDRALTFPGTWPRLDELKRFQPWNKKPFGATGDFPQGKLSADDEGGLRIGVALDPTGVVRIEFGKPIAWLGLPPSEARQLAQMILNNVGTQH